MKYLVILREYFEHDNNTPKEIVWAKISELTNPEKRKAEDIYLNESVEDGAIDAEVKFIPLDEIDGEWEKVEEVWQ